MEIYYSSEVLKIGKNAGSKARNDVEQILSQSYIPISLYLGSNSRLKDALYLFRRLFKIPRKSTIIFQYPLPQGLNRLLPIISLFRKTIVLIHDLTDLRDGVLTACETKRFRHCCALISHNDKMTAYLRRNGLRIPIVELGIFDYLSDSRVSQSNKLQNLCYAGSLDKASFLYSLKQSNIGSRQINVYGVGFQEDRNNHFLVYKGAFDSAVIHQKIEGRFGILWDGDSLFECDGVRGEYLKYNNPHKVSMYIAAGMPIVVWSKAAIAPFLIENGIGIAVDDLACLDETITKVSEDEYLQMQARTCALQEKIVSGFFIKKALKKAIEYSE